MPGKKRSRNAKYVLDTNIQYERLKIAKYLSENVPVSNSDIQTLHYVIYEFKTGFIQNAIKYYFLVDTLDGDTALAKARLSNLFKGRVIKSGLLLLSLIDRVSEKIPPGKSKEEKLAVIEAAINYALSVFEVDIGNIQGSFASNPIVQFQIESADDYEDFLLICNDNKVIEMEEFWTKNSETLDKLVSRPDIYIRKNNKPKIDYTGVGAKLNEIKIDVTNSSKSNVNAGIGDAVIFTDTSRNFTLLTTDNLHTVFAELDTSLEVRKLDPALPSTL